MRPADRQLKEAEVATNSSTLVTLTWIFAPLSLVSIGGGPSVIAEMQQQVVAVHGWMTQRDFADLFAISRAAPGPGALLVSMIGWKVAGGFGVVVASLAFFLPSCVLVYGVARVWDRWRDSRIIGAIEFGLEPITVGLILAGAYSILQSEMQFAAAWTIALLVAVCRATMPTLQPVIWIGLSAAAFAIWNS
jgi:chromate transporter